MLAKNSKLRVEVSENDSGKIYNDTKIPTLKEEHYYVKDYDLDGDAPKQFIHVYYFEKNSGVRKVKLKTWFPFIAKTAEKWYPHESIVEFLINRIGVELGLVMNETKLFKINTQFRFLSKYFLKKDEILIHGAEICGQYLEDNDMAKEIAENVVTARELFTFEFINEAINKIFTSSYQEILNELVKMLTFDALVGNNDRHFYNWGVIVNVKKSSTIAPKFAPIYDSARGLFWNLSDSNIKHYLKTHNNGGKKVLRYIENARPRISIEDDKNVNHFQLIKNLKVQNSTFSAIIENLSSVDNENKVIGMYVKEYRQFFTEERNQLILYLIKERFSRIREI